MALWFFRISQATPTLTYMLFDAPQCTNAAPRKSLSLVLCKPLLLTKTWIPLHGLPHLNIGRRWHLPHRASDLFRTPYQEKAAFPRGLPSPWPTSLSAQWPAAPTAPFPRSRTLSFAVYSCACSHRHAPARAWRSLCSLDWPWIWAAWLHRGEQCFLYRAPASWGLPWIQAATSLAPPCTCESQQ